MIAAVAAIGVIGTFQRLVVSKPRGSDQQSFGRVVSTDDGSFVKDIVVNAVNFAMVESVNRIAQAIGIQRIAEFAENDEILAC